MRAPRKTPDVTSAPRLNPEQSARVRIDEMLEEAGWIVQDFLYADPEAGPGVAVRELWTPPGPMDYALFVGGKVAGSIEAKGEGHTLRGVETQADRYNEGFKQEVVEGRPYKRYSDELLFHYMSTGAETLFTSRRDPIIRPREVFHFHRPETLKAWAEEEHPFRARLRQLPQLNTAGMRDIQEVAISNLEQSLLDDRPRALVAITMGGGKTYVAAAESYRLLAFGGATRILFLVDRVSLGDQARDEFLSYTSPDSGRRFGDDFVVQVLRSNRIDPSANVVICTIQRLYSILRGDSSFDPDLDDRSAFEFAGDDRPIEVAYERYVPIETFDLIFTDECHRSIYGRWGQVLDYFDSFLVGLTATPTPTTTAFFDDNLVAEYTQEQSVYDGINVDQQLYRIRTEVSEEGSTISAGDWVKVRDKETRRATRRKLPDDFVYDKEKLDRAVVNPSQIRTVVRTFRERVCTEMFPGRLDVPKTVFFCKNDQHAEDVLQIVREEFARGSEFARKITYKAEGSVQENIRAFSTDAGVRIAVSVDQIGTGTNIKAVECLVFMRMISSRVLLNQMRGRAVRRMDDDDFQQVTPGARERGQTKDYSVFVDCVGITDEDVVLKDVNPQNADPSRPLQDLLRDIGMGIADDKALSSVAVRLVRLGRKLTPAERTEFTKVTGGRDVLDIAHAVREAADPERQLEVAQERSNSEDPSEEEIEAAREELVKAAVAELRRGPVRQKIEELQADVDQYIHIGGADQLLDAGFVGGKDAAEDVVSTWRKFIEEHHDEYTALKALYSEPYRRRPNLAEIKELAAAIRKPPLNLTPERVWGAYERLEQNRVKGHGGKLDADLVRLVRYTLEQDDELVPHSEVVKLRFDLWLREQEADGRSFTSDQLRWLEMVRDQIAASMSFDPEEDYDLSPFSEEGGITAAYELFGSELRPLIDELNEQLTAA
jgi:type I restriction enzyme R subunit